MGVEQVMVRADRVTTEGDDLYYEVRGQGQPLLMIAGGGGDSWWYSPVADILSDEFKVIIYDRRGNSRSTMNEPQNFEISRESRDAVAVLNAAGEKSAFVLGSSGGAVVALSMAETQPQAVRAVVVHEPPTARVHPKARRWRRFFASIHWMTFRSGVGFGIPMAALRFALRVGLPIRAMAKGAKEERLYRKESSERYISSEDASKFWAEQQLLPTTNYMPDIERIKQNGVKIFMAAGKISLDKKRFYAETVPVLTERLGCEMVVFPGHHVSYWDMPDEWSATLRDVLHKAELCDPRLSERPDGLRDG